MAQKQNPAALWRSANGAGIKPLRDVVYNTPSNPFEQRFFTRPRDQVRFLLENKIYLPRKELAFVQDMRVNLQRYPDATDRQRKWLDAIYLRVWCKL
jgi:hypothetical protein